MQRTSEKIDIRPKNIASVASILFLGATLLAGCSHLPTQKKNSASTDGAMSFESYLKQIRKPAGSPSDSYDYTNDKSGAQFNSVGEWFSALSSWGKKVTGQNERPDGNWAKVSEEAMSSYSSAAVGPGELSSAKVILDNEDALLSKLNAIKAAKYDITMSYYIYADDYTSSLLSAALIAKAKQGVKVKLLVDLFTNYARVPLFNYMQDEGQGNIEVRYYNGPSKEMIQDVVFMTHRCSQPINLAITDLAGAINSTCREEKIAAVERLFAKHANDSRMELLEDPELSVYARRFFAGLYGKNKDLIFSALAEGNGITDEQMKGLMTSGTSASSEEMQQQLRDLMKFLKLIVDAQVKRDIQSMIQLKLALIFIPGTKPVYQLMTALFPLTGKSWDSGEAWLHFTDFTHHKLLAVDDSFVQLGGRNIEDSYHSSNKDLTHKYLFKDVDMVVEGSNLQIANAQLKIFENPIVTYGREDLELIAPYAAVDSVTAPTDRMTVAKISTNLNNNVRACGFAASELSSDTAIQSLRGKCARNLPKETLHSGQPDTLTANDLNQMSTYYVENTPFLSGTQERAYGATDGREVESGKNMHYALIRKLHEACNDPRATPENPTRAIFYQGYTILSANLVDVIGKMIRREQGWRCNGLKMEIYTNSIETTDLNVINILAGHQIKAIYDLLSSEKGNRERFPFSFEYHEYKVPQASSSKKRSLHAKVNIIGDSVLIGSMNLDVRSYFMDTNNGFFLTNASDLATSLRNYIDTVIRPGVDESVNQRLSRITQRDNVALTQLQADQFLIYWANRFKSDATKEKIQATLDSPEFKDKKTKLVSDVMMSLYLQTKDILSQTDSNNGGRKITDKERVRKQNAFNTLLEIF